MVSRLHRHCVKATVDPERGAGSDIETGVQGAVGVEPRDPVARRAVDGSEAAPDDNLLVMRLYGHSEGFPAVGVCGKTGVQAAVDLEPGNTHVSGAVHGRETAGQNDLTVALQSYGSHNLVGARARIERGIHAAGRLRAHDGAQRARQQQPRGGEQTSAQAPGGCGISYRPQL